MTSVKISALPAASALAGTEAVPIVQNGVTVKTQISDFAQFGGPAVSDLAALKALTTRPEVVIVETGQAKGVWQWALGSSTTADDALVVNPTSGTAGRYKRIYNGPLQGEWFGVVADDSSDNATAINAAFSAVSANGDWLMLPDGIVRTSANHEVPTGTRLSGHKYGRTVLRGTGANQTILSVGNGTNNPNDVILEDFSFDYTQAQTTSAAIHVRNAHNVVIQNLRTYANGANAHIQIRLDGGAQQYNYRVRDLELNTGAYGISVGQVGQVQELWIERCSINSMTEVGTRFIDASGIYGGKVSLLSNKRAVSIVPGNGQGVNTFQPEGWVLDSSILDNLLIAPTGTGTVYYTSFVNCWFASAGVGAVSGNNVTLDPTSTGVLDGMRFTGCIFQNGAFYNVYHGYGTKVDFVNCHCTAGSQNANNTYDGYYIGANISSWSIIGGTAGAAGPISNKQRYGIFVAAGTSDYYQIVGVNLRGNVTAGLSDGGTGTTKTIVGCPGFTTAILSTDLIFPDATYDIGKSGATRPRDYYGSRVVSAGTQLNISTAKIIDVASSAYSQFWDGAGTHNALTLHADANYHNATDHTFRSKNTSVTFGNLTSAGLSLTVPVAVTTGTAVGAGANTQAFIKASSTANLGLYFGTGDPTFSAAKGSLYTKTDATTTTTRLWVNTDGGTTWANFTAST